MADTATSDSSGSSSSSSSAAQLSSSRVASKRTPHLADLASRDDTSVRRTRSKTSTDATAAFLSLTPPRRSAPSAASVAKSLATRRANAARAIKAADEKIARRVAAKAAAALTVDAAMAHWDADPTDSMLIELDANNPKHAAELQAVTQRWSSTWSSVYGYASPFVVTRVQRIQNPAVHCAYQTKKAELLAVNSNHSVDIDAWHGSRLNQPQSIVQGGFNTKMGWCQPNSLWFSQYSGYSAGGFRHQLSSGEGQIFSVKLAPTKSESAQAGVYIVGDSARMLPEYLVTFAAPSPAGVW